MFLKKAYREEGDTQQKVKDTFFFKGEPDMNGKIGGGVGRPDMG